MRRYEPLKIFAGSLVVYYAMAACSGTSNVGLGNGPSGSNGGSGGSSSGSASSSNGSGSGDGLGGSGSGGSNASSSGSSSGNGAGSSGGSSGSSGSPVPDANADEPQSGSRLKAIYYAGGDGSKQFAYFTDTQRGNEQCTFMTAADGSVRCLPSGAYFIATEFADSNCEMPVGYTATCASPSYVIQSVAPASGCGYATHVYAVAGGVSNLWVQSGTSCVSAGAPTAGYTYVVVGSELSASSFQQATLKSE